MSEQILSQLKDVHVPSEPSLWPLPFGYYIVLIAAIIVLIIIVYFLKRLNKKKRLRKIWQQELKDIEQKFSETNDVGILQTELSWLTRRLVFESARQKNPEARIMPLESSLEHLCEKQHVTKKRLIQLLNEDRFKATNNVNGQELLSLYKELSKSWRL